MGQRTYIFMYEFKEDEMDCCAKCNYWGRLTYEMGRCCNDYYIQSRSEEDTAKTLTEREHWCIYFEKSR